MGTLEQEPSSSSASGTSGHWQIGPYRFDPVARVLQLGERQERLTLKAAELLRLLAARQGQVVSREQLIDEIWNGNPYTGSRALTSTIWQLRQAFEACVRGGAAAPDHGAEPAEGPIETIAKSGYRLRLPAAPWRPEPVPATATLMATDATATVPGAPRRPGAARLLVLGSLVAVLLLVAALLWSEQRNRLVVPKAPVPLVTLDGVEDYPAFSRDGQRLAYVWHREGSPVRLRVSALAAPEQAPLEFDDPLNYIVRPVWLDADHIAYLQAVHVEHCKVIVLDLRDGRRREVADCLHQDGAPALAASPDGQWLAFSKSLSDGRRAGLSLLHLPDGVQRELTVSPDGQGDAYLAWSHDGRRLGFLRMSSSTGDVYTLELASGSLQRLTHEEAPVWGLDWTEDDHALVFNAVHDGDAAIWRVAAGGGEPSLVARLDGTSDLAVVPGGSGDIAASVFQQFSHTERVQLDTHQVLGRIASSGRDMAVDYCGAQGAVFWSMRSRRIGLWFLPGLGAEARQLNVPEGTPEPADCRRDGQRFAAVLRKPGAANDSLVIGALDSAAQPQVIDENFNLSNANWSIDGRSILLSTNRDGSWNLWRLEPATRSYTRLTDDEGFFGYEVRTEGRLWLYYTLGSEPGLWRRPLGEDGAPAGARESVLPELSMRELGNWQWHGDHLYYVRRAPDKASSAVVVRREADGSETVAFKPDSGIIPRYRALSVAEDGTALVGLVMQPQADILRVPMR
jgi:Tol biopolymer transport system component/DNA-binding winged helix-turn-helix (wHTH) protein